MESRHAKAASGGFFFLESVENGGLRNDDGGRRNFLDACFLCKRRIASDRHAYMYRGDAAFCSEDCRQEQMDMDAALAAVVRRHRLVFKPSSSTSCSRADFAVHAPAVSG